MNRFLRFFTFFFATSWGLTHLEAQSGCQQPVHLLAIHVVPSACGASEGEIMIETDSAHLYYFDWTPLTETNDSLFGLGAGVYPVRIGRIGVSNCYLDTTIVVTNSDGPVFQVETSAPSNCYASNGSLTLGPDTLIYVWSNGEIGHFNDMLNSGCYFVTVTDPVSGCLGVQRVCLDNVNPLSHTLEIIKGSKCGRPTGQIAVTVTGGSGLYSYSLGGPVVAGLYAGAGYGLIIDNLSGCADTAWYDIPLLVAEGTVEINVNHALCADKTGNISVNVVGGNHFLYPYSFSIVDLAGETFGDPGSLPPGDYLLYVADADSCLLPAENFTVSAPPPLSLQAATQPATCESGGQIDLGIGGGLAPYFTHWTDIQGFVHPSDRENLFPGRYTAIVYDSIFCTDTLGGILITEQCPREDTLRILVEQNSSESFCLPDYAGLTASESASILAPESAGGASAFGTWTLTGNCLQYNALQTLGIDLDRVRIIRQTPALGAVDTFLMLVSILNSPLGNVEKVYFTTQIEQSVTACATAPLPLQPVVLPLNVSGLNGVRPFGAYQIDPLTACMQFEAFSMTGYNVDSIAVAVCDPVNANCHIRAFLPTVLPYFDCSKDEFPTDTLSAPTTNCIAGGAVCMDIVYTNVFSFNILDNGLAFSGSLLGCNEGQIYAYPLENFPDNLSYLDGPYRLKEWTVNGQIFSGVFGSLGELVSLLNELDPSGSEWIAENDQFIIGGDLGQIYGPMIVENIDGEPGVANPTIKNTPLGSNIHLTTGYHQLIFKKIQTGCSDTLTAHIECFDCPPIHLYNPDIFGVVAWEAPSCAGDTLFCTQIPLPELSQWQITDNFEPITSIFDCNGLTAFRLDTGYHELRWYNTLTTCTYAVPFYYDCRNAPIDTIFAEVTVNETIEICLDTSIISTPIITIYNICPSMIVYPNIEIDYDESHWCVLATGVSTGHDTLCVQICNADGQCVVYRVVINVTPAIDRDIIVYNGISPNGDGENDVWIIEGIDRYPDNEVKIYNRYGNLVYRQNGYVNASGWIGTWNENPLPDGTYYYTIDLHDGQKPLSGFIQLMR